MKTWLFPEHRFLLFSYMFLVEFTCIKGLFVWNGSACNSSRWTAEHTWLHYLICIFS